ncbi:death domain-associated protein [Anaeramoeba flamelloides]|uniref:Death domain-associated protein n=1 Tax=Anaeramoeba flamelloides TaxID=1746091 RepID=A0ABQ8ZEB0_9EUKA|nr:death domain-associated protein [Anaeramoeba flamelloides]
MLSKAKKNKQSNSKKENEFKQTSNKNHSNKNNNDNKNKQGDYDSIHSKKKRNKKQNTGNRIVLEKKKENSSNNIEIYNKSRNNTDEDDDSDSDNNNNNNHRKGMKMSKSKTLNEIKLESESRSQTETKYEVNSETDSISNTLIRTVFKNKKKNEKQTKSSMYKNSSDSNSRSEKESKCKNDGVSESESESGSESEDGDEKERKRGGQPIKINSNKKNPQKRVVKRIKLNRNERNHNIVNRNGQNSASNQELSLGQRLTNLGRLTFKRPRSYSLLGPSKMNSSNSNYPAKNGFTINEFKPKKLLSIGPDFQILPKMMKSKTKELELFQDLCKNMQKIGTTTIYAYECFYLFSYLNGKQDNELKSARPKEKKVIERVKRRVIRSFKESRKKMQKGRSLFKVKICSNTIQTYEEGEIHIDKPLFRLIYKEDKSEIVREKWNNSIRIYIHKTIREIFVIKLTKKNQTFIIRADSSHEKKVCLLSLYLFCRYSKKPRLFGMCPEIDGIPTKSLLSSEIPRPIFYPQKFDKRLSGWLLVKKKQSLIQLMERFFEKNGVNFILYIILKRDSPYQRGYLKIRKDCIKIGLGNLTFFRFPFRDNPELFNHKSESNILKITSKSFDNGLTCLSQSEQDKQLIIKSVLYFKQKWLQQEKKREFEKMKSKSKSKSYNKKIQKKRNQKNKSKKNYNQRKKK